MTFLSLSRSFPHGGERFDDGFHALAESRTGEVLVDHFRFGLLAFRRLPRKGEFQEFIAENQSIVEDVFPHPQLLAQTAREVAEFGVVVFFKLSEENA